MTRIIGIDPGLVHTGWAVIDTAGQTRKYIASGVILPKKTDDLSLRLAYIFNSVSKLCEIWNPDICSIEITFSNTNPKTTLVLGHARAAAMVAVAVREIPVFEYEPNKIKKAITGAGHADKDQIYKMVKMLLPDAFTVTKDKTKTADEVDAIAIALAHSNMTKFKY